MDDIRFQSYEGILQYLARLCEADDGLSKCDKVKYLTSVQELLHSLADTAKRSGSSNDLLKDLLKLLEKFAHKDGSESNELLLPLVGAVEGLIDDCLPQASLPTDQFYRLLFTLPSQGRVNITLRILPSLIASMTKSRLPIPASAFWSELCCYEQKGCSGLELIGSELLCVISNNSTIFTIDEQFLQSPVVWKILRDGVSQPGMACLRALNVLENLIGFCLTKKDGFRCRVVVDGSTLFSWSKEETSKASLFWQTYLPLFTSLETSQSAHVIDPFLSKIGHLFAAWSSLDISEYWLELFCQRACGLGNFSVSKRFMHALLQLDFVKINVKALKFLPKILADAFTDHRFFAIAHSPTSTRHFLSGDSYAEKLHQIFVDLCAVFRDVICGDVPVETKRDFLASWFSRISQSGYSAPSLSFMLFACSPDGAGKQHGLRLIDSRFLNVLRDTLNSHMASSETEFKFLFAISVVRALTSYVDYNSVPLYELMRFVCKLTEILDAGVSDFALKTLFKEAVVDDPKLSGYLLENELETYLNHLLEQQRFDKYDSLCLNKYLLNLLALCDERQSSAHASKVVDQLSQLIESVVGKLSTNPYMSIHRVLYVLDLIFSVVNASSRNQSSVTAVVQQFFDYCKRSVASTCEDVGLFFVARLTESDPQNQPNWVYAWEKWIDALLVVKPLLNDSVFPHDSLVKMASSLIELYLASVEPSIGATKACSLAVSLLHAFHKYLPHRCWESLTPVLRRLLLSFDNKIRSNKVSLADVFRLKNVILGLKHEPLFAENMEAIECDLAKIVECADVIGTDSRAMQAVFKYCQNVMDDFVMRREIQADDLERITEAIYRAVAALFEQVRQIVESAEPSWRVVLQNFLAAFLQRGYVSQFRLLPVIEKVVDSLYAIGQSRHEVWLALMYQIGGGSTHPHQDGSTCLAGGNEPESKSAQLVVDVLMRSLLFGQVGRRSRFFAESYYALRHLFAKELGCGDDSAFESIVSQQLVSPAMIRLQAMRMFLPGAGVDVKNLVQPLVHRLIGEFLRLIEKVAEKRPFTNSQAHRDKHRTMMAILFLLGTLDPESADTRAIYAQVWDLCLVKILPKELFTSVRYLAQWCMVLLLSFDTAAFFNQLLSAYDKAVAQRNNSLISSYMDILGCANYFLVQKSTFSTEEIRDSLMKVFDRLVPACIYNHFLMRARAQAALVRLWRSTSHFRSVLMPTTFDSRFVDHCVAVASDELNKPVVRNLNNFFYRLLPIDDYAATNNDGRLLPILHFFLPRCGDLFVDEFAYRSDFTAVEWKFGFNGGRSTSFDLWQRLEDQFGVEYQSSSKPDDADDLNTVAAPDCNGAGDGSTGGGEIIQRKLTNWRKLLPCFDEESLDDAGVQQPKTRPCSDLLLVASLIDKPSNLGGLCRSADVFGLSTISLPSLDKINDRDFESLAVSAHKWLKIVEVPAHQLSMFLLSLKNDGYTLVAAEQATESVPLPDFKFPRKTALILGNEREGIPPHILQLVDTCVEIAQYGVAVRSLNVHVTGALFMYSYSCQHAAK